MVIPDIGGLRPLFHDMAQRLADENGWAVATFEPWAEGGPETLEARLGAVGDLSDARLLGDAVATADLCGVEPVGIIGFCMGGMYTLKAAGTGRFHRAVAFYGMIRIPEQWAGADQGEPLAALAAAEACPTMAVIGLDDQWTPPEDVAALEDLGVTVARYEGAGHGFVHDPDRPGHVADAAADAWARTISFLSQ